MYLDYLLSIDNLKHLLVIAAKRDDLDDGITQLFSELIAIDQWERSPNSTAQSTLLAWIIHQDLGQISNPSARFASDFVYKNTLSKPKNP